MKDDPRLMFDSLSNETLLSIADVASVLRIAESTTWRLMSQDAGLRAACVRLGAKMTRLPAGAVRQFMQSRVGLPPVQPPQLAEAQAKAHAKRRAHPNAGRTVREAAKKQPTRRKAAA